MDDTIKYSKGDTPFSLAEKIIKETGGYLPVKIAFEDSNLARAIIENSMIKNLEKGVRDWMEEGLILGGIPPGHFEYETSPLNIDKDKPYSSVLIYDKIMG